VTLRRAAPIRVLINGVHAKSGGGLTYLRNILPELASDEQIELHLFLHRDQMDSLYPLDERIRIHLFEFPGGVLRLLAWEQFVLPFLARVMGARVTLSPANYGPLAAPGAVIMLRNSLAVAGRETRLGKRLYWLALAMMTALSLLACRRAIAVSHYARHALTFGMERWFGNRVVVIHHGVTQFFSPTADVRVSFLLVVGDLYIQKNLHTLLLAMGELKERFPEVTLRIAGRAADSDYERELRRLVAMHGLEDRVDFLGSVDADAVRVLYRQCMALVFPSTVETFGNPLVEAMACGTPVVCSNRAAMPEIAGDAALYFDPLSQADVERALTRIILDEDLRADLARRGLQRARAYSWRQTAEATAQLLRSVADNTG
jgi:glycosyltransferase involved in cell wall biosynthesis